MRQSLRLGFSGDGVLVSHPLTRFPVKGPKEESREGDTLRHGTSFVGSSPRSCVRGTRWVGSNGGVGVPGAGSLWTVGPHLRRFKPCQYVVFCSLCYLLRPFAPLKVDVCTPTWGRCTLGPVCYLLHWLSPRLRLTSALLRGVVVPWDQSFE